MTYTNTYLNETAHILELLDDQTIEQVASILAMARHRGGRLFFLGIGGSAANCSHAVNDFRKIAGFEAYTPTDNVAELTARANDDGWITTFETWLRTSRLTVDDVVFVLSVGGGTEVASPNIALAIDYTLSIGATVVGIVGRAHGATAKRADACILIPTVNPDTITPHAEECQSILCHLLVTHPLLKRIIT